MEQVVIRLRLHEKSDEPFLFHSWLRSYCKFSLKSAKPTDDREGLRNGEAMYKREHEVIEALIGRAKVVVACERSDTDHILGYVVFETTPDDNVIHYIYVKQPYRRMGVARELLGYALRDKRHAMVVSCITDAGRSFLEGRRYAIDTARRNI